MQTLAALSPYQRKNAYILRENLEALVEKYGIDRVGFLTLTFPKHLTLKQANARFNSLATNLLNELFEDWVNVREFTSAMRPHMHLVVVARGDIRTGFNFPGYLEMTRLSKRSTRKQFQNKIRELSRNLAPSPVLRSIWDRLRLALPAYGFGRHELIPIRKTGPALAYYVGGYIRKSIDQRPDSAKGARLISYSKGFDRRVNSHQFQFNTTNTFLWRRRVEMFARLHSITDFSGLSLAFGPRWAWWFRDVIESLNLLQSVNLIGWEVCCMVESVDKDRLNAAIESGSDCLKGIHLYRPQSPLDAKGVPIPLPRHLVDVFGFHLNQWNLSESEIFGRKEEIRAAKASPRRSSGRSYVLRPDLTGHTHEALEALRSRLLEPVVAPVPPPPIVWDEEELNDPWWKEFTK